MPGPMPQIVRLLKMAAMGLTEPTAVWAELVVLAVIR